MTGNFYDSEPEQFSASFTIDKSVAFDTLIVSWERHPSANFQGRLFRFMLRGREKSLALTESVSLHTITKVDFRTLFYQYLRVFSDKVASLQFGDPVVNITVVYERLIMALGDINRFKTEVVEVFLDPPIIVSDSRLENLLAKSAMQTREKKVEQAEKPETKRRSVFQRAAEKKN